MVEMSQSVNDNGSKFMVAQIVSGRAYFRAGKVAEHRQIGKEQTGKKNPPGIHKKKKRKKNSKNWPISSSFKSRCINSKKIRLIAFDGPAV